MLGFVPQPNLRSTENSGRGRPRTEDNADHRLAFCAVRVNQGLVDSDAER